jgi:hypothetical protein
MSSYTTTAMLDEKNDGEMFAINARGTIFNTQKKFLMKSPVIKAYIEYEHTEAFYMNYSPDVVRVFLKYLSGEFMVVQEHKIIKRICDEFCVDFSFTWEYGLPIYINARGNITSIPYCWAKLLTVLVEWDNIYDTPMYMNFHASLICETEDVLRKQSRSDMIEILYGNTRLQNVFDVLKIPYKCVEYFTVENNHQISLADLIKCSLALNYASGELRNDRPIVMASVSKYALDLRYAGDTSDQEGVDQLNEHHDLPIDSNGKISNKFEFVKRFILIESNGRNKNFEKPNKFEFIKRFILIESNGRNKNFEKPNKFKLEKKIQKRGRTGNDAKNGNNKRK